MPFHGTHVFFSYSRKDDEPKDATGKGWVERFHDTLKEAHRRKTGRELTIFFDKQSIDNGELWKPRLMAGMKSSRLFIAFLSPNYVRSPNCRWEWKEYLRREHILARGGDGILPVYFQPVPGMPGGEKDPELARIEAELRAEGLIDEWLNETRADLHKRQAYMDPVEAGRHLRADFDLRAWFRHGPQALAELDAAERLDDLRQHPRAEELDLSTLSQRIGAIGNRIAKRYDRCVLAEMAPGFIGRSYTHFVGRHTELADIHEALVNGAAGLITAVHGMGGMGKTALAVQYAHAYAEHYAAGGRYLLDCEGETSLPRVLRKLSTLLGMDERRLPVDDAQAAPLILARLKQRTEARGAEVLGQLRQQEGLLTDTPALPVEWRPRALLLFDNVDEPELFSSGQTACLPEAEWLEYILTTRLPATRFGAGGKQMMAVPVDSLPIPDAVDLIREFYPGQVFPSVAHADGAEALARALGGFTLAVEMAGAYLGQHPEIPSAAYLRQLEEQGLQHVDDVMESRTAEEVRYKALEEFRDRQLRRIIEMSIVQLETAYKDLPQDAARTLLDLASCLPPDRIVMPWLKELVEAAHPTMKRTNEAEPDQWVTLWEALHGMRFLHPHGQAQEDHNSTRVSIVPLRARMHRLTGSIWRDMAGVERLKDAVEVLIQFIDQFSARLEQEWVHGLEKRRPIRALAEVSTQLLQWARSDHRLAKILGLAGTIELYTGNHVAAGNYLFQAHQVFEDLAQAKENDNEARRLLLVSLSKLGDYYKRRSGRGDTELMLSCYERCLEIAEAILSTQPNNALANTDVSIALERLCNLFMERDHDGDMQRVLPCLERARAIREAVLRAEPDSPRAQRDLSVVLSQLGRYYNQRRQDGDTYRATESFMRSLHLRKVLYSRHAKSNQASRDLSVTLSDLGSLFDQSNEPGDRERALECFTQSVALCEQALAADRDSALAAHDMSAALNKLGAHYLQRGGEEDLVNALKCFERDYSICQMILEKDPTSGETRRATGVCLDRLGDVYNKRGGVADLQKAELYFKKSLEAMERLYEFSCNTAFALKDLYGANLKLFKFYQRMSNMPQALVRRKQCHVILHKLMSIGATLDKDSQQLYSDLNEQFGAPNDS